jgi:mRNA interferase MazF
MKTKRGDIVLVLFPDSNSTTAKRRPALIIQADGLATGLPQVIFSMISSNLARNGPPFRIFVPMNSATSRGTGLRTDSVIMLDNLATVIDRHIDKRIGSLADMAPVDAALRNALAL